MKADKPKHVKRKERAERYYGYGKLAKKLYERSKNNEAFTDLMGIIEDERNIAQAYRSLKRNKGANTLGTDQMRMKDIGKMEVGKLRERIREKLKDYHPQAVRRKYIPKKKPGEKRPLGIPTSIDKMIQQMMKQVLEAIFEAKFKKSSYGFRPKRNQHEAIEHINKIIVHGRYTHAIEFDIKKYFDTVDHNILEEIIRREGIKDPRVLGIIRKMLRAPIKGEGKPEKGTPQGGVLSPLLANIYLNELDRYIYNEYQDYPKWKKNGKKIRAVHIVRYADDFVIFVKTYGDAKYYYEKVVEWLKRMRLEHAPEKTRITNLKRRGINFLGIKIKAAKSRKKAIKHLVAKSYIPKESIKRLIKKIKEALPKNKLAVVRGTFQYWQVATEVSKAASRYNYLIMRRARRRKPKKKKTDPENKTKDDLVIDPERLKIIAIHYKKCRAASQETFLTKIEELAEYPELTNWYKVETDEMEKYDIIRSKFSAQNGRDAITRKELYKPHCHRIRPGEKGGEYVYTNCILINEETHQAIHGTIKTLAKFIKSNRLKPAKERKLVELWRKAHE